MPAREPDVRQLAGNRAVATLMRQPVSDQASEPAGPYEVIRAFLARQRPRPGKEGLARELLGYEPRVDFREGLRRTVEWYRQNAR